MMIIALNVSNLIGKVMGSIMAELLVCAQLLTHVGCWWWVSWGSWETISSAPMLHSGQKWGLEAKPGLISPLGAILSSKQHSDAHYAGKCCLRFRRAMRSPLYFQSRSVDELVYCLLHPSADATLSAAKCPGSGINWHLQSIALQILSTSYSPRAMVRYMPSDYKCTSR